MQAVTTIGLDIAKSVFQVHGVDAEGNVLIRRQLKRRYVLAFFQKLPPCLVGIEACATSHHWTNVSGRRGRPGATSAGQENMLDVSVRRPHPGAEQSIIRFPEPSAHFTAHVHLDQRKLLEIPRVDLVEVGG
jgi:hypothetical protein